MKYKFSHSRSSQKVFNESISARTGSPPGWPRIESPAWLVLSCLLIVFWIAAAARLVDLQIVRGSYFRALAEGNRIRRIPIRAPRGQILDRGGQALARNSPVYKLATFSSGGVIVQTQEISREEALGIQASDPELEARLLVDIEREYQLGEAAAHLVGYVNEVSSEEVDKQPNCTKPYRFGDVVGRMGVEAQYDCILRGVNGEELIEVDTQGRLVRRLGRREPIPGKNIQLTVDSNLQKAGYQALADVPTLASEVGGVKWDTRQKPKGAFIAQNPQDGTILALVSYPSFDPNSIAQDYSRLTSDEDLPLFNRAVSGAYPPGSTFKIVTAAAGLEDGKVTRDFRYTDTGVVTVGAFSYKNWLFTQYGRTEGEIDIVRAITRSTDTFFYEVGGLVGVWQLSSWAKKFGLGERSGIDLPAEVWGLVPDPDWKEKTKGERWFLGNTYHLAIGQGDIATSPLQINQMTLVIASGGKWCKPRVAGVESVDRAQECKDVGLEKETVRIITEGMIGACSPGGTAFPLFNFKPQALPADEAGHEPSTDSSEKTSAQPWRVACKTGTAQTYGDKTHAWLTAFGPIDADSKRIATEKAVVVTALVEEGGEGSRVAAPVVKKVLEEWFGE